jgi:hypothetical protein
MGPGVARVNDAVGSGRMTLLWAREWHHGLGDGACVVDGVTDLGRERWWHVKGLDDGEKFPYIYCAILK